MDVRDLVDTLMSPEKTRAVVDRLDQLVAGPLRERVRLPLLTKEHMAQGCPCRFLIQQVFDLPDSVKAPIRLTLESVLARAQDPKNAARMRYLGLTATHACGDGVAGPAVRWGFSIEAGATWSFGKGANRVFAGISKELGLDEPTWSPVPNFSAMWIAFVGRRFGASELARHFESIEHMLDSAAADIQVLNARLAA